jgi:uncharacterized Fe-S cluster-containing radical SAM superfamily protein
LCKIAKARGYSYARISGGEPTLCKDHLLDVIRLVNDCGVLFILETNGLLIGRDEELARALVDLNVFVRVSIKAPTPEAFERVTGACAEYFEYQLRAFENLLNVGFSPQRVRAAVVVGYGSKEEYARLVRRLASIHPALADVEWEVLVLYPSIKRRLEKFGLLPSYYVDS